MIITNEQILDAHGIEIPAHLEAQAEVPVLAGLQRQGDIIAIPHRAGIDAGTVVPADGVPVVRGENGGNTHLLVAIGDVHWRPVRAQVDLGVMTVGEDAVAYLLHPEHGAQGFAPGSYLVRRQREQADEIRVVAD